MKHLGDITKIKGDKAPPVNVVIGGSPCQDLSVAGRRAGLAGERSGLFMEQLRVIKEMRKADADRGRTGNEIRPRFMVWENVPGAFSSNKGADFGAVLQETIRVVEEAPSVPMPKQGWPMAGCFYGAGGDWSVAYRVFDAQFWGTPQRRRRIALVADFGGMSAPEILFERKSVCGDTQEGGTEGQGASASPEGGSPLDDREGTGYALNCNNDQHSFRPVAFSFDSLASNSMKSSNPNSGCREVGISKTLDTTSPDPSKNQGGIAVVEIVPCTLSDVASTLRAGAGAPKHEADVVGRLVLQPEIEGLDGYNAALTGDKSATLGVNCGMSTGRNGVVICLQGNCIDRADTAGCNGKGWTEDKSYTLNTIDRPAVVYAVENHPQDSRVTVNEEGIVQTLNGKMGTGGGNTPLVLAVGVGRDAYNSGENAKFGMSIEEELQPPLTAKGPGAVAAVDFNNRIRVRYIVRRLTPLECERLQGFPDGWTDIGTWTDTKGKVHKESTDSARYKALGNSIALPSWYYVLQKLSLCCVDKTMASLFDGIGGFPLLWETLNGDGTCLWASEIEEFPIAVTKKRFPEEEAQSKGKEAVTQ